nr:PAS domain S-box protein [uncultured Desulfobacter sp.]
MGLRHKFMILIILIFIPIFGLLFATGYSQVQQTKEDIEKDVRDLISQFIEEQKHLTLQTREFLKILTHVPAVKNLNISECNAFLQSLHKQTPQYSTLVAADAQGLIDCCAIPLTKTINVKDRNWFKRIKESRKFIVDTFIISRSAQKASLPLAYPVLDDEGNLKGAVGAAINLEYYNSLFKKSVIPKDSIILLTDHKGSILYQSSMCEGGVGKPISECYGFTLPSDTGDSAPFEVQGNDGISRVYWYEWFWIGQEHNLVCIVVGISKQIMFADIKNSIIRNIFLLVFVALISLIIAWFTWERLIRSPIDFLIYKTQQIKQGKWHFLDYENLSGELLVLSTAFDDMAKNLLKRERERDKALLDLKNELNEKRKTERELREKEERLNVLFRQAADPIFVSDLSGQLTKVNKAAIQATGYTEDELINMNVIDIDSDFNSPGSLENLFGSLIPGHQKTISSVHQRKDGTTYPVEITVTRIHTPDGPRVMGIARDITERKRMNEVMIQNEKMLSVGGLAAGMAHEINNPLAGIVQNADLLQNRLTDKNIVPNIKAAESLGTDMETISRFMEQRSIPRILYAIKDSGLRMAEIVENMLNFARKSDDSFSSHDPIVLMDKILELASADYDLKKHYDFRSISIEKEYASNLPMVSCESAKIQQVVLNILNNGAQAMFENRKNIQPKFILRLSHESADNMLRIEIEDNGPGMDADTAKRIFEPFFTTKPVGVGTGLGLSVSYFIITENHKGSINVISEPGEGAHFVIRLPIERN